MTQAREGQAEAFSQIPPLSLSFPKPEGVSRWSWGARKTDTVEGTMAGNLTLLSQDWECPAAHSDLLGVRSPRKARVWPFWSHWPRWWRQASSERGGSRSREAGRGMTCPCTSAPRGWTAPCLSREGAELQGAPGF